jgi:mannose-6-phosphate isomerase-like protein (cupin superfamily)
MPEPRVTRIADAPGYVAPLHHGVDTVRLQGLEAGPTQRFWVGLSQYRPGGGAELAPAREETVYVVLDGELEVDAGGTTRTLTRHDSIHLPKGSPRRVGNTSSQPATLLVIIAHPSPEEGS